MKTGVRNTEQGRMIYNTSVSRPMTEVEAMHFAKEVKRWKKFKKNDSERNLIRNILRAAKHDTFVKLNPKEITGSSNMPLHEVCEFIGKEFTLLTPSANKHSRYWIVKVFIENADKMEKYLNK